MRNLSFVSILSILLAAGCVSIKPPGLVKKDAGVCPAPALHIVPPDTGSTSLFSATMVIKSHRLTGILLFKRMDRESFRVVFASEIGMTWFDLQVGREGYQRMACMPALDRKALLSILASDFRLVSGIDSFVYRESYREAHTGRQVCSGKAGRYDTWHTFSPRGDTLTGIAARSGLADAVIVTFEQAKATIPLKIILENPIIGLRVTLKRLKQ